MDIKILIFSMCHIFSSEFEFPMKSIKFVAVVGGGADSAVSVIQLKGNTCKTCLPGIFMKNAFNDFTFLLLPG